MPNEQTIKDAARLSAAARSKKGTYNTCRCCGAPVKKPYWNHISCKQKADAEFKARIEALPEKPVTLEIWCRMWGMTLDEGRESYANWTKTHG